MVLTYEYILKEELFEDLLRVTRGEIDECVAIVQQAHDAMRAAHANFNNLRGGIYRAADFVVWLFSFSAIYRNLSVMATILGLHVGQVQRKVYWTAKVLASALKERYVVFKTYEAMKSEANKSPFGRNAELEYLHGVPVFVVDGTGVPTFKPSESRLNRLLYCWFKRKHQIRCQVVIDITGHAVYIGRMKEGHMSDNTAMALDRSEPDRSGFVDKFSGHFDELLRKEGSYVIEDVRNALFVILGDKGYGKFVPPPRTAVVLTASAEGLDEGGCRYIDRKMRNKCIFTSPIVAPYRSLIERVFGRIWNMSSFLRGPIFFSQLDVAHDLMVTYLALSNRALGLGFDIYGQNQDSSSDDENSQ